MAGLLFAFCAWFVCNEPDNDVCKMCFCTMEALNMFPAVQNIVNVHELHLVTVKAGGFR